MDANHIHVYTTYGVFGDLWCRKHNNCSNTAIEDTTTTMSGVTHSHSNQCLYEYMGSSYVYSTLVRKKGNSERSNNLRKERKKQYILLCRRISCTRMHIIYKTQKASHNGQQTDNKSIQ